MTTIPNFGDERLVQRMSAGYSDRYTPAFWGFFNSDVRPRLGANPTIVDIGCGPGLLLRDMARYLAPAKLVGIDNSESMLDTARSLHHQEADTDLIYHDLNRTPFPLEPNSVDLFTSGSVVVFLDDPFELLQELRRTLKPEGVYLLFDWQRQPLSKYVADRSTIGQERHRIMGTQAFHNRYSIEDWHWILRESGFKVVGEARPRPNHVALVSVLGT